MVRPCFLVVDREYAETISTRKLLLESAKLNVITAYSGTEAVETLERYPKIDGVVLDADIEDIPLDQLVSTMNNLQPGIPIVVVRRPGSDRTLLTQYEVEGFDPTKLLAALRALHLA